MARPRKAQRKTGIEGRGKTFSYRLRVPDSTAPSGFRQVRFGGFLTPEEADKDRLKRKSDIYEKTFVLPTQITVAEYFPECIERHFTFNGKKPQTKADYLLHFSAYILPRIGLLRLDECTSQKLEDLLCDLKANGSKKGTPLAFTTIEKVSVVLGVVFKEAYRKRLIGFNPMSEVRIPRGIGKRVEHLSDGDLQRIRHSWQQSKFAEFFELSLMTGARKGELFALRWDDWNEETRTLSINKTQYELNGRISEGTPKTPQGFREVEVSASQAQRLKVHRARQLELRLKAGSAWQEKGYLFTNEIGEPLLKDSVYYEWKKICKRAGVSLKHLHALRHTHITLLLQQGVQPHIVARRAGDKVITILQTYAHAIREDDSKCAELFDRKMVTL